MIRALRPEELPEAAALSAAAFREDPGFRYIVPDDAARRRRLPALLLALLRVDQRAGGRVNGVFEGNALVGVSSVLPASVAEPGLLSWLPHAPGLGWLFAHPALLLRGAELARALEPQRPLGMDYLHLLAVHPACQGRGAGAALIEDARSGGSLHLETFEPANRRWYAARGLRELYEVRSRSRPPFWVFRS